MPRVNIYLNEATSKLVSAWKDKISLSEVFARALQDEISAIEDGKDIRVLSERWCAPTQLETDLQLRFGLERVIVVDSLSEDSDVIRRTLGATAARYVDEIVSTNVDVNVCGGRQSWEVVRNLSPRRVATTVRAYGVPLTELGLHHLHSNTLATIVALLYQPRSQAELVVGSSDSVSSEHLLKKPQLVLGSCSVFDENSAFAKLLGKDLISQLVKDGAVGEFAYSFWDHDYKELVELAAPGSRRFTRQQLSNLSKDSQNNVILVAGGNAKRPSIAAVVENMICNVLVTTVEDGMWLLRKEANNA